MKTVTVSSKGQIVIPQELRKRLGLEEGVRLRFELAGETLILRPMKERQAPWQHWRGRFGGKNLLKSLADEHAKEMARDRRPRS